jgi:hypothetical protein
MRFLDKKVSRKGDAVGRNAHEVVSDLKVRSEGVRIKHRLGKNSIKLYDKAYSLQGAVLRPEITINAPEQFRVFRHKSGDPDGEMAWRTLRRGIADLHRRAEVNRGEFAINGLRNRDLQALLFSAAPANQAERRRRSAIVSLKLQLLRAHGILHNLPHTHRYQVSDHGRLILNAVLSAQRTTTQQLTTLAA